MPVSNRHIRAAAKAGPQPADRKEYKIIADGHRPDAAGEFAGQKVQMRAGGVQVVSLTDNQAQFYLDQNAIELLNKPADAPAPAPAFVDGQQTTDDK